MKHARLARGPLVLTALLVTAALAVAATAAAADRFTPGAPGLGDPFFPDAGNGGYDVSHYGLTLSYEPSTNQLSGTATITRDGDAEPLALRSRPARLRDLAAARRTASRPPFTRDGQELVITPAARPPRRLDLHGRRRLRRHARVVTDPDGSIEGWVPTDDGAFVVGEPQGSPAWYPVNDNPRDKATFDFSVTVPAGLTVMANGVLVSHHDEPAAGRLGVERDRPDGAVPRDGHARPLRPDQFDDVGGSRPTSRSIRRSRRAACSASCRPIVDFYASIYGPYPFNAVGAIVDNAKVVGYSLETQTKPVFDRDAGRGDARARDLAHVVRRLGDADDVARHLAARGLRHLVGVDLERAPGQQDRRSSGSSQLYNTPAQDTAFWTPPPGDPGCPRSCSTARSTYRGGDDAAGAAREDRRHDLLPPAARRGPTAHRYGNVTTPQFIALAEQVSGMRAGPLLRRLALPAGQADVLVTLSTAGPPLRPEAAAIDADE